jgi:hypothetical protein
MVFRAFLHYIGRVRNIAMKPLHLTLFAGTALAVALAFVGLGAFSPAFAQPQKASQASSTPNSFPYEIVNGRRVPRANKTLGPDGSWREEIKDGPCVTLKEKNAAGEYREVRKCD